MGAQRRRPRLSRLGAAAVPLLLLLAASFGGRRHAAAEGTAGAAAMTELQKHAAFFDSDHDGVITFDETYQGLMKLGVGSVKARASAALINGGLGPKTRPVRISISSLSTYVSLSSATASSLCLDNANSSSRMDIYIVNIRNGIHGSDTGAYDAEGRFVPEKLDEMFTKHGKTVPDAMTKDEVDEMLKANRDNMDFKGWLSASSEWKLLYKLAKDKDGYLRKDDVRGVYDGGLFYRLAAQGQKD